MPARRPRPDLSRPGAAASRPAMRLPFTPGPGALLDSITSAVGTVVPEPVGPSQIAAHVFRLLRPADLVALDVMAFGMELRSSPRGPELVPVLDEATLRVTFAFQHLGEEAYAIVGDQLDGPRDNPPIDALAAKATRLVFAVAPEERIAYSHAGVLAALSRLPLKVAPHATPRPVSLGTVGEVVTSVVTLTNGVRLARTDDGRLAVATERRSAVRSRVVPSVSSLLQQGVQLRAARTMLAHDAVVAPRRPLSGLLSSLEQAGGKVGRVPGRVPTIRQRPRAPKPDETSIEAPFRLIVSPSVRGGFAHAVEPVRANDDAHRVELWHTRLGVRVEGEGDRPATVFDGPHPQRALRAIWARDKDGLGQDEDIAPSNAPFRMSLNASDRLALVRQSSDVGLGVIPRPVQVDKFALSALGVFMDVHGYWSPDVTKVYAERGFVTIESWDHEAMMGRDQYVRVAYPGYLFPFGHKALLVKVTERRMLEASPSRAYLYQRFFIVITEPVRQFNDRRVPFSQVTLRPLVTPDLRDPTLVGPPNTVIGADLFWPTVPTGKFRFTLDALDHNRERVRLQAPLLFVSARMPFGTHSEQSIVNAYAADNDIGADGQSVAFAPGVVAGDTTFESHVLRFLGTPGPAGSCTSSPHLKDADLVIPALRHLAPSAPLTTVTYADPYTAQGFEGSNTDAEVFLQLTTPTSISFAQDTGRSGGFIQPDLPVRGLSRALGTVGRFNDLLNGAPDKKFNPAQYLEGVFPRLFGLFDLVDILEQVGLDRAPRFVTEQLDRVAALLADLDALQQEVERGVLRLADDAAKAATAPLRAQAEAARSQLAAVQGPMQTSYEQLRTTIGSLLALAGASTLEEVGDQLRAILGALQAQASGVRTLVNTVPLPPTVKARFERLLDAVEPALEAGEALERTITALWQFVQGLDPAGAGVRARFEWRPKLRSFHVGGAPTPLFRVREDGLLLSVEARASGSNGVGVDAMAELRDFTLTLFPQEPLMALGFDRLAFRAATGRKPEVDVIFRSIEFLGVLSFIDTLRSMIPFDGWSDPPYVDVSAEGVTAGFDVALPSAAVGVFSLENISLGADARVPFLGNEALTIGFNFCTREKPFRLTVMMIGGGGFVGIRLSPRGLVVLEMALEAGASLSINLGVASGSVSVMVGVYLRLEEDAGSLTGYFRIRGEVDVLGLISACITLELSLKYEFASGKLVGRASIEIEVDVFLVSFTVTVTCERRLAGSNGDPTLAQILGPMSGGEAPAWTRYCAAFAEA